MEIKTKDGLLEQISLAVEQIQKQFVQGGNVIKDCQETFFLCQCIDNILHHGLKEGLISWAMEPTIWPLLEKITCSKDIEEIKMLHLKTDKEKCSAWVKMAVNGNLLGSYIATIGQDHSLLSNHYYEYAFLRDPVMADTVKSLLNYGIANFDFQISISQSYLFNQSEIKAAKHERSVGYDVFEKASKENGYESPKTETESIASHETWSKKKRKKKKQHVKTAVIEDQDDYGEVDGTVETEKQNSDTLLQSLQENCEEIVTKTDSFGSPEEKNSLSSNDETRVSNMVESSLVKTDQSGDDIVNDVRPNSPELSINGHATNPVNDHQVNVTDDQSAGSEKEGRERVVLVSNELDQYLTHNSQHDFERSSNNDDKKLDSLGRIAEIASSKQEFSANDFLLDQTEPQNIVSDHDNEFKTTGRSEDHSSFDTKDNSRKHDIASAVIEHSDLKDIQHNCSNSGFGMETSNSRKVEKDTHESFGNNEETSNTSKDSKENSLNLEDSVKSNEAGPTTGNSGKTEEHSPRNEELSETVKSRGYVSRISQKSERRGTGGSGKDRNESNDEFSEILSSGNSYDYRVRKIENPELFSSSYGSSSAQSDFTDDDRDLNFIPGIHRMSSKSFSSSFEKKSATDSFVSFDENGFPVFESSHYTDNSSSHPSSNDDVCSSRFTDLSNEWDMFEDLLNVEEEHFSQPDNFAGLTTGEELEMAIEHYKRMIKMKEKSKKRDDLVQKLIKLRLRLQQEKEGPPVENPKYRKILSHEFSKTEGSSGTKYFCDQCGKNIWTIWQSMFTCNGCGYHSHRKCMEHIQRPCPNKNLSSASYILDICPDTGLDAQQYRCAECRKEIAFSKDDVSEARICDYTGQYFCENCHWNDQISIPARVLRNWDFAQHKVCRKSKQLLELMKTRPIINIQEINPMLYRYVEELREVGKLRDDILIMKKYFLTCREALESKLLIQVCILITYLFMECELVRKNFNSDFLRSYFFMYLKRQEHINLIKSQVLSILQLQKRQHFVESAHTYSFQDLVDLNNDVLLPEVSKVHALFLAHIKADCELCRARGFICEVCQDSSDIIFAFDPHAVKCTKCSAVFHKICFKPEDCPKCHRKKKVAKLT